MSDSQNQAPSTTPQSTKPSDKPAIKPTENDLEHAMRVLVRAYGHQMDQDVEYTIKLMGQFYHQEEDDIEQTLRMLPLVSLARDLLVPMLVIALGVGVCLTSSQPVSKLGIADFIRLFAAGTGIYLSVVDVRGAIEKALNLNLVVTEQCLPAVALRKAEVEADEAWVKGE